MKEKNKQKPKRKLDNFVRYSSLAFEMVAIMGAGTFAGIKIDGWLQLKYPIFTLVLMTLSVIVAIYQAIKNFI